MPTLRPFSSLPFVQALIHLYKNANVRMAPISRIKHHEHYEHFSEILDYTMEGAKWTQSKYFFSAWFPKTTKTQSKLPKLDTILF